MSHIIGARGSPSPIMAPGNVCKKASKRIGVIRRLRNRIPTEAKLHLYKAAILPHLTYCHLVWHFCRASDTRRLERVQVRGLPAVFRDRLSSYQQLLEKANLPTLYNTRPQDIYILIYKVKHNLYPRTICNMFYTNSHTYSLRQRDFHLPRFNTVTYGKHSIPYLRPNWHDNKVIIIMIMVMMMMMMMMIIIIITW